MDDVFSYNKWFLLLLLALLICCEANPLESDIKSTTPCADELNISDTLPKNVEETLDALEDTLLKIKDDLSLNQSSESNVETTTNCEEKVEEETSYNPSTMESQEVTTANLKDSEKLQREIINHSKESSEKNEETTICPEEMEKRKKESIEKKLSNNLNKIDNKQYIKKEEPADTHNEETTTACPEALQKKKLPSNIPEVENTNENFIVSHKEVALQKESEIKFDNDANKEVNDQQENNMEGTTICPDENKAEDEQTTTISVQNLLYVQKDSALYKLVKNKLNSENTSRNKRQVASSYYSQQPTYNSQGVAVDNKQNYNTYKSLFNEQRLTPVRTYQQMQRQYQQQNYLQKQYKQQSYLHPTKLAVKNYQRYPNSYNNNNYYYKSTLGSNRRQFQRVRQSTSTTTTTKPIVRRKFRPSPVFP